jgi:hypothetical protein
VSGSQRLDGLEGLALALTGPLIYAFKHHSRLGLHLADEGVGILVVSANESVGAPVGDVDASLGVFMGSPDEDLGVLMGATDKGLRGARGMRPGSTPLCRQRQSMHRTIPARSSTAPAAWVRCFILDLVAISCHI